MDRLSCVSQSGLDETENLSEAHFVYGVLHFSDKKLSSFRKDSLLGD